MEFTVTIQPDGKIVTEVVNRGQHLCTDIYKVTARLGRQTSDEDLPDDGQSVHNSVDG